MGTSRSSNNWISISESNFPWEREALEFVRAQFPSQEPYRAWSNFEFIADDGSVNEVDLLVFTPQGFFLIEIKSQPGRLSGDAGTWTWQNEGKLKTVDNPYQLANSKAKKLRPLLQRQKACKVKGQIPYIDALVFCSAPGLNCELQGTARSHVCLRDRPADGEQAARAGIMSAILRRDCDGLDPVARGVHDRPTMKIVLQSIDQAGIRPSQRSRKVSDYVLDKLINEGPGYQDWQGTHATLKNARRRIRIYNVRAGASNDERQTIERAARREAELLESLQHPGVLRREGFTEHELGPALIFEHDPSALRLDHYLAQNQQRITVDQRLDILRQIAEVMRFAHEKRIIHRALCPQSILITTPAPNRLQVKVFNWQVGYRGDGSSSTDFSRVAVSATSHVDRLVDDASTAYMAPEAISEAGQMGEHLDVFSLGAIAYHLFSGVPPASNGLELSNKLRESKGLQISSVMNGAGTCLQELIQWSTHADVGMRPDSVSDFLDLLEKIEDEATTPDQEHVVDDPDAAKKDDLLPGGFKVIRRIGKGAVSVVFLVERDQQQMVLKVAANTEFNERLKEEAAILNKLRHSHIVELLGTTHVGDHEAFLMRPVLVTVNDLPEVETLGRRLRKEGRLHVDLLQRFGEDLLGVLNFLEEQGINHRDIKPDNIAVGHVGSGKQLHLVLFDFSLSRTPPENIRAGTTGYLDPFLPLRQHKRWDLHAERFAAAVTLYQLATGPNVFPRWGDGTSDPSHLDCEATIDGDLFDASLREGFVEFFQRAFRRDTNGRFDNAERMLAAWRDCFVGLDETEPSSVHEDELGLAQRLASAVFDTQIHELGLGVRATNALDRANILTVEDLLTVPVKRLMRLRGVGDKTRREIVATVRTLRERLGRPQATPAALSADEPDNRSAVDEPTHLSVDQLIARLTRLSPRSGDSASETLQAILGLDARLTDRWPSQSEIAPLINVTRGRIGQLISKFQLSWSKEAALTKLRSDIADILVAAGGVMSVAELADAILVARGSIEEEPRRSLIATAVVRAASEVERTMAEPRFHVRRDQGRVLVATSLDLATYAARVGDEADSIAGEDPLVAPARVLQRLREVSLPDAASPLTDARLVRLSASASRIAALSSRQELYPRGMDASRALKLSQGALYGVPFLTEQQIRDRVISRYPEAAPLPDRPWLDDLMREIGFEPDDTRGDGGYVSRQKLESYVTSGSESLSRLPTASTPVSTPEITPEIADARQFEERLQRGLKDGSFLALVVPPKSYQQAARDLVDQFSVELVDFEGLFIDALQEVASKAGAKWDVVVNADAVPGSDHWKKLLTLVNRAMPLVEQSLVNGQSPTASLKRSILLIYPGLLARYDQMPLLERLRDEIGRGRGLKSCWLLVPGDQQPMLDGKAVPLISAGQRTRIPDSWLRNEHRSSK